VRFRKLTKFSPKAILQAITELQEFVAMLIPRESSGTLRTFGSGGTTVKASKVAKQTGSTTVTTSGNNPSRWA